MVGSAFVTDRAVGAPLADAADAAHVASALATAELGGMDALPRREDISELRRTLAAPAP